jgi:hypothetical protein
MSPNIVMRAIIYALACTASLAATAPTLGPYGEVITPNGTVWGLKDAFNGTFKTGVSFVRHSQLWKDPVCYRSAAGSAELSPRGAI